MRALPTREPGESLADFAMRVKSAYMDHLEGCRDCNYDYDCIACAADGDGGHSCNCSYEKTDNGFGFQLSALCKQTSDELLASEKAKRWHSHKHERIENPRVDAFLAEIEQVSRKHGMSISHEDSHGAFVIHEQLSEHDISWLKAAHVDTEES